MKKICGLILFSVLLNMCLCSCSSQQKAPLIKSERRLGKYFQAPEEHKEGIVDLSDGPKLKYDASFGPASPSFDFTIKDPY